MRNLCWILTISYIFISRSPHRIKFERKKQTSGYMSCQSNNSADRISNSNYNPLWFHVNINHRPCSMRLLAHSGTGRACTLYTTGPSVLLATASIQSIIELSGAHHIENQNRIPIFAKQHSLCEKLPFWWVKSVFHLLHSFRRVIFNLNSECHPLAFKFNRRINAAITFCYVFETFLRLNTMGWGRSEGGGGLGMVW